MASRHVAGLQVTGVSQLVPSALDLVLGCSDDLQDDIPGGPNSGDWILEEHIHNDEMFLLDRKNGKLYTNPGEGTWPRPVGKCQGRMGGKTLAQGFTSHVCLGHSGFSGSETCGSRCGCQRAFLYVDFMIINMSPKQCCEP